MKLSEKALDNQYNTLMAAYKMGVLKPEKLLEMAGFKQEEIDKIIMKDFGDLDSVLCELLPNKT